MKILVGIKTVASYCINLLNNITPLPGGEPLSFLINPYDYYAVEEGLKIKDQYPETTVTIISMGPPKSRESLKQLYYMGVDEVILLSADEFAGADTLATGYTLQKAIEKIGNYDLVICGQMTVDGDTGQVVPILGSKLGIPYLTNISQIVQVKEERLLCRRQMEYSTQLVEADMPLILSVQKGINNPRSASLRLYSKHKDSTVTVWQSQDIDADPAKCGYLGSATVVLKTDKVNQPGNCEYIEGQGKEVIEMLVKKLIADGISYRIPFQ